MTEYRIYYSPSIHDSWIQGGFTAWTNNRAEAEHAYDYWKNAGHYVTFYERTVSIAQEVER